MIVDIEEIKKEKEFKNEDEKKLIKKLKAIEKTIRSYTNNKFMNLKYRTNGRIRDGQLYIHDYYAFKNKDNIELSYSFNDDVYTITGIEEGKVSILEDINLLDCENVMITKVIYPEDIQEGVINMLKWDFGLRNKVGIKSETISRHSVTYFDMDATNSIKGYPIALLGFLDDYIKMRC